MNAFRKKMLLLLFEIFCCFALLLPCTVWGGSGWFWLRGVDNGSIGWLESCSFNMSTGFNLNRTCLYLPMPLLFFGVVCFGCSLISLLLLICAGIVVAMRIRNAQMHRICCLPWQSCVALLALVGFVLVFASWFAFSYVSLSRGYWFAQGAILCVIAAFAQLGLCLLALFCCSSSPGLVA